MSSKFQKTKEDLICENCGEKNVGTGYTNHCKKCLWSKHVDINPGDRAESCKGMMCPQKLDFKGGKHIIYHKCIKCKAERKKILEKDDDFEAVLAIAKKAGF